MAHLTKLASRIKFVAVSWVKSNWRFFLYFKSRKIKPHSTKKSIANFWRDFELLMRGKEDLRIKVNLRLKIRKVENEFFEYIFDAHWYRFKRRFIDQISCVHVSWQEHFFIFLCTACLTKYEWVIFSTYFIVSNLFFIFIKLL